MNAHTGQRKQIQLQEWNSAARNVFPAADDHGASSSGLAESPSLQITLDTISRHLTRNARRRRHANSQIAQMQIAQEELNLLAAEKQDISVNVTLILLEQQQTIYQVVLEVGERAISSMNLFGYLQEGIKDN